MRFRTYLLVFFVFLSGLVQAGTRDYPKRVFGYAYSYSYETKVMIVSRVVRKRASSFNDSLHNIDLQLQWGDQVKATTERYYIYTDVSSVWYDSRAEAHKERRRSIGEFRSEGFAIYYDDDFRFFKEE